MKLSISGGGASAYFDGGKYYYRKKLVLPEEWRNKTMILSCEGVYQNAQVSVNNQVITKWPYGYSGFYVDMTEHLSQTDENITKRYQTVDGIQEAACIEK